MNRDIETLLAALEETPRLLKELVSEINPTLYKKEIIKGKWSIHDMPHMWLLAIGMVFKKD